MMNTGNMIDEIRAARILAGEASDAELKEHKQLLESDLGYREEWNEWLNAWQLGDDAVLQMNIDTDGALAELLEKAKTRTVDVSVRKIRVRVMRLAAAVAAVLTIGIGMRYLIDNSKSEYLNYIAGDRLPMEISLSDGSKVTLNRGASLEVVQPFRGKERRVSLSGEAWFEVAPDSKHPFIVGSGEFEVRVVGTQFNVRNVEGAETFNVEVLEGIVDLVRLTGTDSPLRLKAGDGAVFYHRTKTLDRVRFSMNNIAWKSGRISFDDSPLLDVFATLERVYGTRLVANDASILQERLVGTFAYDDFDHIIDVVCRTFNLRYEGDSAMIMVYRNN
ncbi:MAG: FecR domain-containing protein [Bacteroidota bacterium]|mgnify:FL=1|jgi:transmembrane sensor|nr:FecR domain-containing protein [Bacteroidota bacterium]HHU00567.1 DUF4974 domain-containing protein [Bacteroidales bacterium]